MPSLHFPSVGHQVLSCLVHLLGVSVLSFCFARRVGTLQGLAKLTWPRICIILLFVDSWLFLLFSGLLIFGFGLELHAAVCQTGVFACIFFYATSKLFVYFFLIERVHVVWMPGPGIARFKSRVYILCFITVCIYSVVIGLMVIGRIYRFRDDDAACILGLKPISSYPLLIYDLYINVFLTSMFLVRLRRTKLNARLKRIATHALISATIALTTSTTNIVILGIVGGTELGWLCLASCGMDVIINALSIFWVTSVVIRPHRTVSVYSSGTNHFRPASGPVQSILKQPLPLPPNVHVVGDDADPPENAPSSSDGEKSQSQSQSRPSRLRLSSLYDRFIEESIYTSSPRAVETFSFGDSSYGYSYSDDGNGDVPTRTPRRSSYIHNPNHPFAKASYMPRAVEPQVEISAHPARSRRRWTPSAVMSLAEWFRRAGTGEEVKNVEVAVTTQTDIESFHEENENAEIEGEGGGASPSVSVVEIPQIPASPQRLGRSRSYSV